MPNLTDPPPAKRRRRWVFAVVPALALLLLLEGGAWIADGVTDYRARLLRALDAVETHAEPLRPTGALPWPEPVVHVRRSELANAEQVRWRVGGVEIADSISQVFDTPTDPDDARVTGMRSVFVVGGSAAFGHPYPHASVFPSLLDDRLGERGLHVLNAGQIGWPSAGVADVVDRVATHYEPAAVIILCGNNEWIHWTPPHTPWDDDVDVTSMRTWSQSRAVALLQYWTVQRSMERMDEVRAARDGFAMHRELSGVDYALEHPLEDYLDFDATAWLKTKDEFLDVFETNLRAMVASARAVEARAILVTVPFNYRLSPAWKHPQPESFLPEHRDAVRAALAESAAALRRGDAAACLVAADRALVLDRYPPVLHALRATALERLGRPADAEAAFAQCREHMVGHLGARLSINERIREVASSESAELLDAARLFDERQHESGGHFNVDLLHDDSHPTLLGHRILAEALAELF